MRTPYEGMQVMRLGTVGTVVNKTGAECDNSMQFETKSPDQGGGTCNPLAPGAP